MHDDVGPPPRALIYALGGGHGHTVRGSVLAEAWEAQGGWARVLVPSSLVWLAERMGARPLAIERPTDAAALARAVDAKLAEHQAELLVVDTFPEGLLDELSGLRSTVPRVALLRCRTDAESERLHRGHAASAVAFDLEPHLEWRPEALHAEPFGPIIRPLPPVESAVDVLLLGTEAPLSGLVGRLAGRLRARGLTVAWTDAAGLHGPGTTATTTPAYPLPPELLAAPVVVGPAGFNLSYELCRLGGWHVALPRPRPFDDQARRARAVAQVVQSPQAAERLVVQLCHSRPDRRGPTVHEADALAARVHAWWSTRTAALP